MQKYLLILSLLLISACNSKEGYSARFYAPKSDITGVINSAVTYKNADSMAGIRGYSKIIICSKNNKHDAENKLEIIVDKNDSEGNPIFKLNSLGQSFNFSSSDFKPLLKLLNEFGYTDLDQNEVKRLNEVFFNSISSSKRMVLRGQGREIEIRDVAVNYVPKFSTSLSVNKWLDSEKQFSCNVN